MAMNFVPLDKKKHKDLRVTLDRSLPHAKNSHLSAASIREYAQLSASMPIIFIKDPQDNYRSVGVLGIEQDVNLFLATEKWKGPYVPMNVLRYPFDVRQDGEKLGVYIDENSDLLKKDEGEPLFDGDNASEYLMERQKFLTDLANSELQTKAFIDVVTELDLIEEIQLLVAYSNGDKRNVTGMFSISEKKLLELDDAKVTELHKKGYLGACYSLMLSLGQLSRLVELSNDTENPIQALQIQRPTEEQKTA